MIDFLAVAKVVYMLQVKVKIVALQCKIGLNIIALYIFIQ